MARHNFRKLNIWKDGVKFVSENYKLTNSFPNLEQFNLTSQMNRSSLSIPSNIVEGSAKSSDKHFKIFLEHSLGSSYGWETQLEIAFNLKYVSEEKYSDLIKEIQSLQKRIGSFIDSLS